MLKEDFSGCSRNSALQEGRESTGDWVTVTRAGEAPGEQTPGCELSGCVRGGESRAREGLLPRRDRRNNRHTWNSCCSKIKDLRTKKDKIKEAADMSKGSEAN